MHLHQIRQLSVTPVVPDAGRDTLAKDTKIKKGIIGSQPRGNHNVFTHYPKDPKCEVCEETNTTQARCRITLEKGVGGDCTFHKIRRLDHGRSKTILNVENESRGGHKNALIVQDDFTNWIHSFPMKTKDTSENNVVFTEVSTSVTEAGKNLHRERQRVFQILPRFGMESSETNGVAERAVRRVIETTATATMQSGLPEEWRDCAID